MCKDTYTCGLEKGVRTYKPVPFSKLIKEIRTELKTLVSVDYEVYFSNKYRENKNHLGWHADDSDTCDTIYHNVGITIFSFGAERLDNFRKNGAKGMENIHSVPLPHGSILVMPPGFQQTHQHRIPKAQKETPPRISLTFRKLV